MTSGNWGKEPLPKKIGPKSFTRTSPPDQETTFRRKGVKKGDPNEFLTVGEYWRLQDGEWSEKRRARLSAANVVNNEKRARYKRIMADTEELLTEMAKRGIINAPDARDARKLADSVITTLLAKLLEGDLQPTKPRDATDVGRFALEVSKMLRGVETAAKDRSPEQEEAASNVQRKLALVQREKKASAS